MCWMAGKESRLLAVRQLFLNILNVEVISPLNLFDAIRK